MPPGPSRCRPIAPTRPSLPPPYAPRHGRSLSGYVATIRYLRSIPTLPAPFLFDAPEFLHGHEQVLVPQHGRKDPLPPQCSFVQGDTDAVLLQQLGPDYGYSGRCDVFRPTPEIDAVLISHPVAVQNPAVEE